MSDGNGDGSARETHLVTGFPAFTARRLVRKLLERPRERVYLLAREKFRDAASEFVAELRRDPALDAGERLAILEGDVCDMDLGLTGAEYRAVAAEVTTLHHLAGIYYLGVKREVAERVNVDGTRAVLDLASECGRLRRLVHWSTAQVSGARAGVILEEELDVGQRFRNHYEETKFRAEKLVDAARGRLPVTILRPGVIVGDSRTGEIDKFDGPYSLIVLIVTSPLDVHLPLPGRGSAPLHLAPIDFVVDAADHLARDGRAAGRTFHVTDPCPFAARTVYELCARHAERKPPRGRFPTGIARAVLRVPGIADLARAPLALVESFNHMALYNCRNTLALLAGSGISCPPFDTYAERLVEYVRAVQSAKKRKLDEESFDPFD